MECNQTLVSFYRAADWKTDYQRNNKQNGTKNLRCFPYCRDEHRDSGFCGQPVSINLSRKSSIDNRKLYVWAEFLTENQFEEKTQTFLGVKLTKGEIDANVRTKKEPLRPWYSGDIGEDSEEVIRSESTMEFHIKSRRCGWNYVFMANKHTAKILHCLTVYVFAESIHDSMFECIGIHKSPSFRMYCRRRQRPTNKAKSSKIKMEKTEKMEKLEIMVEEKIKHSFDKIIPSPFSFSWDVNEKFSECAQANNDLLIPEFHLHGEEEEQGQGHGSSAQSQEGMDTPPQSLCFAEDKHPMPLLERRLYGEEAREQTKPTLSNRAAGIGGRKRGGDDEEYAPNNLEVNSFDFGKVPTLLNEPFPLRTLEGSYRVESFDIPLDVLSFFGVHDTSDEQVHSVRRELWRICIILSILDSHWRVYPELYNAVDCNLSEPTYEFPEIKYAFIEIAKSFGSFQYQRDIFEIHNTAKSLHEKEHAYVQITVEYFIDATAKLNMTLETFYSLFYMHPPEEVMLSAKQRLRSVNGFLRRNNLVGFNDGDHNDIKCKSNSNRNVFKDEENEIGGSSRVRVEGNTRISITKQQTFPFNPNGFWRFDADVLDALDHIRTTYLKTSWVMRKIYTYMESDIKVNLAGPNELIVACGHRLMQGVAMTYKLDGQIYKFMADNVNIPFARPAALTQRSFLQDYTVVMETFFELDQNTKLVRTWTPISFDNESLQHPVTLAVSVSYARRNASGSWDTAFEAHGFSRKAERWSS